MHALSATGEESLCGGGDCLLRGEGNRLWRESPSVAEEIVCCVVCCGSDGLPREAAEMTDFVFPDCISRGGKVY